MKTCTAENICSGFRRSGIVPFSPDADAIQYGTVTVQLKTRQDVVGDNGQDKMSKEGDEGEDTTNDSNAPPHFTREQEELYTTWFEEGYNIYDPDDFQWLEVFHPEASSISVSYPVIPVPDKSVSL